MTALTLIYGEEPLLNLEALDQCRRRATAEGFSERLRFYSDELDWSQVALALDNQGMFASRRLVEIHFNEEKKLDAASQNFLKAYRPAPDCWLLLFAPNLEKPEQSAWFKAIKERCQVLSHKKVYGREFQNQLRTRVRQLNLNFSGEALALLQASYENNLLALHQLLQQLAIFNFDHIDGAKLREFLHGSSQYQIFTLTDALLNCQWRTAYQLAARLGQSLSDSELVKTQLTLTALIGKDMNLLLALHSLKTPEELADLFRRHHIPNFKQNIYHQAKSNYTVGQLENMLRLVAELDRINKGGQAGDFWLRLKGFLLERCR